MSLRDWVDFREVREAVSMEALRHYQVGLAPTAARTLSDSRGRAQGFLSGQSQEECLSMLQLRNVLDFVGRHGE